MEAIARSIVAPKSTAYTLGAWVTGNPIVADAGDPNSSPPLAARIVRCAPPQGALAMQGLCILRSVAIAGTSVVYQPWFYDTSLSLWVKFGATITITVATTNISQATTGWFRNAQWFNQIVTVNGTVTAFGYGFT